MSGARSGGYKDDLFSTRVYLVFIYEAISFVLYASLGSFVHENGLPQDLTVASGDR